MERKHTQRSIQYVLYTQRINANNSWKTIIIIYPSSLFRDVPIYSACVRWEHSSTRSEVTCVRVEFSIRYTWLHNQKNIYIEKLKCISLICSADHERCNDSAKNINSSIKSKYKNIEIGLSGRYTTIFEVMRIVSNVNINKNYTFEIWDTSKSSEMISNAPSLWSIFV